jgi:glutamine synthetase
LEQRATSEEQRGGLLAKSRPANLRTEKLRDAIVMTSPRTFQSSDIASSIALLRTLSFAKVKFIRYLTLDICGNVRCKVIPVEFLRKHPAKLLQGIALVKVSVGGLPSYADHMVLDSGLTAAGTLLLRPDLATMRILPYAPDSAVVLGTLYEAASASSTADDPMPLLVSDFCCSSLLQRVVQGALVRHNITFTVGVELEFVLFDAQTRTPIEHSNFADTSLLNQQQEFVSAVYDALQQQDISIELIHAESASGQMEIVLEYRDDPVTVAHNVVLAREAVKAIAHQHGLKAIFLPKFNANQAGNGCHVHVSLRDAATGQCTFAGATGEDASEDPAAIMSPTGQSFVEGILQQLPALMAVTMPTMNSFRRVGVGCWTGSQAAWAVDDKEAPLRVIAAAGGNSRVEFKLCDSSANLYLALAALLTAGLDGVARKLPLRTPLSNKIGQNEEFALPTSIHESLNLLENNELLRTYIPVSLMKGYFAVRRAEALRAEGMSLDQELQDALDRS